MTTTIGNPLLPGVTVTQESSGSVNTNLAAPSDVGLVGVADLSNGSASANVVQTVTTAPEAARLFGSDSPLGKAVIGALQNGAYPVYAVATDMTDVTAEDLGTTASGTLGNAPVTEVVGDVTFTVDGSAQTTVRSFGDVSASTPAAGETYYNPVDGSYKHDTTPTASSVDYKVPDYASAISALSSSKATVLDFVGVLNEAASNRTLLNTEINAMAQQGNFAIGAIGHDYIADTSTFTNPLDTSRMQVMYSSRDGDGDSMIGSYLGVRGRVGMDQSGMRQRLVGHTDTYHDMTDANKVDLDAENVLVTEVNRGNVRMMNDPTSVGPANTAEAQMADALARLVIDYVTNIVDDVSEGFIGKLHVKSARQSLESIIAQRMKELVRLNAVVGFTVSVAEVDSVTASVEVGVETAKPLRNINATIVAGEVTA